MLYFNPFLSLVGCMSSWIGDRYCDTSCNNVICGYDAGDCGVDGFTQLHHIDITTKTTANITFKIPLGNNYINGVTTPPICTV